jgi:hypothetical protein
VRSTPAVSRRSSEVQAGRGRSDRTAVPRVHGLVALAIRGPVRPRDVGWQRDVTDAFDRRHEIALLRREPDRTPAVEVLTDDLPVNALAAPLEDDEGAGLELLPGVHQGLPDRVATIPDQQALDRAAAGHTTAQQPRRKDSRVVDDEQVARS